MDKVKWHDRERVSITDLLAIMGLTQEFFDLVITTVVGDGLVIYSGFDVAVSGGGSDQVDISAGIAFDDGRPLRLDADQCVNVLDGSANEPSKRGEGSPTFSWGDGDSDTSGGIRIDIVMIQYIENLEDPFLRFFLDDTVDPPPEASSSVPTRENDFFDIIIVHGTPGGGEPDVSSFENPSNFDPPYVKLARITIPASATDLTGATIDHPGSATPYPPGVTPTLPPIQDIFPVKDEAVVTDFPDGTPTNYMDGLTDQEEVSRALDAQIKVNADAIAGGVIDHDNLINVTANQHHNQIHAIDGADHTGNLLDNDILSDFTGEGSPLEGVSNVDEAFRVLNDRMKSIGKLFDAGFIEGASIAWVDVDTVEIRPGTVVLLGESFSLLYTGAAAAATLKIVEVGGVRRLQTTTTGAVDDVDLDLTDSAQDMIQELINVLNAGNYTATAITTTPTTDISAELDNIRVAKDIKTSAVDIMTEEQVFISHSNDAVTVDITADLHPSDTRTGSRWYFVYAVIDKTNGHNFVGGISSTPPTVNDRRHPSPPTDEVWRFVGSVWDAGAAALRQFRRVGQEVIYEDSTTSLHNKSASFSTDFSGSGQEVDVTNYVPETSERGIFTITLRSGAAEVQLFFADGDKTGTTGGLITNSKLGGDVQVHTNTVVVDTNSGATREIRYRTTNVGNTAIVNVEANGYRESVENL